MNIKKLEKCRFCESEDLDDILNLGDLHLSGFVKPGEDREIAPLNLVQCKDCNLVQLGHTVNLDEMYRQYWYKSSLNKSMIADLRDIVDSVQKRIKLDSGDVVVDIGTNDGTLLNLYVGHDLVKVGYDPAYNLASDAKKNCDYFINDYFTFDKYPHQLPKPAIITAIAMFYDLPDIKKFLKDVKALLVEDGIFVIQLTDLTTMLKINAIDNVCHEHLEYYKLSNLIDIMDECGLEVFDIEHNSVNGGSIRVYISHPDIYEQTNELTNALVDEFHFYAVEDQIESFKNRLSVYSQSIVEFIRKHKNVYALGASTKGNTLLQVLGLTNKDIKAIGEVNPDKFELITAGTHIPIIPEDEVFKNNPDLILILPWHFHKTFIKVTKEYLDSGGEVLFPLPHPHVILDNGGFYL